MSNIRVVTKFDIFVCIYNKEGIAFIFHGSKPLFTQIIFFLLLKECFMNHSQGLLQLSIFINYTNTCNITIMRSFFELL